MIGKTGLGGAVGDGKFGPRHLNLDMMLGHPRGSGKKTLDI